MVFEEISVHLGVNEEYTLAGDPVPSFGLLMVYNVTAGKSYHHFMSQICFMCQ